MYAFALTITLSAALLANETSGMPLKVLELLDNYAAAQKHMGSWVLDYTSAQRFESSTSKGVVETRDSECNMRFDGERVFWRWHRWGGVEGTPSFLSREKAYYLSLLWDGRAFSSYRTGWGDPNGVLMVYDGGNRHESDAVRYEHIAAPLFGYYLNVRERVDKVLREANSLVLRGEPEDVNGIPCPVIEAQTKYGDYTVWIDPAHGYNIAKAVTLMSETKKHVHQGRPLQGDRTFTVHVVRFETVDDTWVPMEIVWEACRAVPGKGEWKDATRVTVSNIALNPDHDALGSFVRDDVKEGAWGSRPPAAHIRYRWYGEAFVPEFDGQVVGLIDKRVQGMLHEQVPTDGAEPNGADVASDPNSVPKETNASPKPRRPKPFCGLYCTYAALKLTGNEIDFPELIKPEYFGSHDGSSLMELRKAAADHGLHAEPAAKLSARGFRHCPYRAILHVRSSPESPKYDHYEMFLGTEDGKAKLFNPPEEPRLVSFADLATRWDGKALLVSDRPIDIDTVLATDRQQFLWYGMTAALVIVAAHFGRRLWLSLVPALPRRWALGLTAGQAAALGLAALLCGGFYQFASEGGLLANAVATQAFQKGHAASFIPKVREGKVHRLLGTETVFIDARFARDYKLGHLEGAISLPIDANDTVWKATTATIPKNAHIVTYCQSAGCKFGQTVSLRLIEEGYSDVSIFKGGWAEWVARHGRPRAAIQTEKKVKIADANEDDPT